MNDKQDNGAPAVETAKPAAKGQRRFKYVPVIGPRLKILLAIVFGLFAVLGVNSVYLASITLLGWKTGQTYENYFYMWMILVHLALGLAIVLPVVLFGIFHMRNAHNRPNRRAVRAGYALFSTALVLLISGIVLTRLEGVIEIKNASVRGVAYWAHVISPVAVVWLFVLHRLAGRRIKWKIGLTWAAVAGVFALIMTVLHSQDPRKWNVAGPKSGEQYFFPSLARTSTGNFIPAKTLLMNDYCLQCHPDTYKEWFHSAHRFSSFSNPAYLFSVRETRRVAKEHDGTVQDSRWCAGCHDPVPFFSGAFEDKRFDDPNYDLSTDPMASAGITCTACHAITNINSLRGNADFTIEEPTHYPFAYSDNSFLKWVNRQLVKAKPEFHKKTFLKPLHKTAEFCSACHKVHLPPEVNNYKWLRGQNHYDSYILSGVSGHFSQSWYYPPKATHNCSACHMPLMASDDFGAKTTFETDTTKPLFDKLAVHNHMFPAANTGIPSLLGLPSWVNEAHDKFMDGFIRVDLFGLNEGPSIDSPLIAPLRPNVPTLKPGSSYLLDAVVRTVKIGHPFTQGTVDSNEVWLDVKMTTKDGRVIARSGGLGPDGEVDPWSHFINVYMLDRNGNRIDRRNPQDIFTPLYNHQIPPGAADVIHYSFTVPPGLTEPITIEAKLLYRKFDTKYMKYFQGDKFVRNDLPISTLAADRIVMPIEGVASTATNEDSKIEPWQRWNDYGIGLFRKGDTGSSKGELRQAEAAFMEVEKLGKADGALNRARVYLKQGGEGDLERARDALNLAANASADEATGDDKAGKTAATKKFDVPAAPWSLNWFSGQVSKQNGQLAEALMNFKNIYDMKDTAEAQKREFDFRMDYELLNELGQTTFELAKGQRGDARRDERERLLHEAVDWFNRVLAIDVENVNAHYNLSLIYAQLGEDEKAEEHHQLHLKYKPDDNAKDRAIAIARMNDPAANHAAEAVVIYDLQRPGAFELPPADGKVARHDQN